VGLVLVIPEEHRVQKHMNSHYCALKERHCHTI